MVPWCFDALGEALVTVGDRGREWKWSVVIGSYGQGETNYPRPLFPPDIISGLVSKLYYVFKNRYIEKGVVTFNFFQKN